MVAKCKDSDSEYLFGCMIYSKMNFISNFYNKYRLVFIKTQDVWFINSGESPVHSVGMSTFMVHQNI